MRAVDELIFLGICFPSEMPTLKFLYNSNIVLPHGQIRKKKD